MPLDLGIMIPKDDGLRTLRRVTERMDFTQLDRAYERRTRANEATPKQLFELVILGFMNGKYSLRKIEEACRCDIRFMYLLGNCRIPDHARFGRFIRERLSGEAAEHLFYQFVGILNEMGEVAGENVFVDGTKIEANANRYTFVWGKAVTKNQAKLREKTESFLAGLSKVYPETAFAHTPEEVLAVLAQQAQKQGVEFVCGKGKHKTQLQRDVETLESYITRDLAYRNHQQILGRRNSYSKTDHDATFMRMKEDHMRNGQLKPAYNVQFGVEAEYIVGAAVSAERNDVYDLLPLLECMIRHGVKPANVVTDAGYESEENYTALEQMGITAYIKPQNYEKSRKPSFRQNAYLRENMSYDREADVYTCPANQQLFHSYDTVRSSKSGFEQVLSVYNCHGCDGCSLKGHCTKSKYNRRLTVSKTFDRQRAASLERISSPEGIQLRVNRSIQSEGAFGVLKEDWGFRRFLRRGYGNVLTEIMLYSFAFDVQKLHAKTLSGRTGQQLFLFNSA